MPKTSRRVGVLLSPSWFACPRQDDLSETLISNKPGIWREIFVVSRAIIQ